MAWMSTDCQQRAEVGVVGDDHPIVDQRSVEDLVVRGVLQPEITNGDGVVASGCEESGHVW